MREFALEWRLLVSCPSSIRGLELVALIVQIVGRAWTLSHFRFIESQR